MWVLNLGEIRALEGPYWAHLCTQLIEMVYRRGGLAAGECGIAALITASKRLYDELTRRQLKKDATHQETVNMRQELLDYFLGGMEEADFKEETLKLTANMKRMLENTQNEFDSYSPAVRAEMLNELKEELGTGSEYTSTGHLAVRCFGYKHNLNIFLFTLTHTTRIYLDGKEHDDVNVVGVMAELFTPTEDGKLLRTDELNTIAILHHVRITRRQVAGEDDKYTHRGHYESLEDEEGRSMFAHDEYIVGACFMAAVEENQRRWNYSNGVQKMEAAYNKRVAEMIEKLRVGQHALLKVHPDLEAAVQTALRQKEGKTAALAFTKEFLSGELAVKIIKVSTTHGYYEETSVGKKVLLAGDGQWVGYTLQSQWGVITGTYFIDCLRSITDSMAGELAQRSAEDPTTATRITLRDAWMKHTKQEMRMLPRTIVHRRHVPRPRRGPAVHELTGDSSNECQTCGNVDSISRLYTCGGCLSWMHGPFECGTRAENKAKFCAGNVWFHNKMCQRLYDEMQHQMEYEDRLKAAKKASIATTQTATQPNPATPTKTGRKRASLLSSKSRAASTPRVQPSNQLPAPKKKRKPRTYIQLTKGRRKQGSTKKTR